jgi:hypothetical protein
LWLAQDRLKGQVHHQGFTIQKPSPANGKAKWKAVHQRRHSGQSLRQIGREVGLGRKTVRRYLSREQSPVYP